MAFCAGGWGRISRAIDCCRCLRPHDRRAAVVADVGFGCHQCTAPAAQTEFCKQVVRDWLGEGGLVANAGPVTASEVFALFPGEGTGLLHQYRQWRG